MNDYQKSIDWPGSIVSHSLHTDMNGKRAHKDNSEPKNGKFLVKFLQKGLLDPASIHLYKSTEGL